MPETVKLIYHTGQCNLPDDESLPFKLWVNLSPPEQRMFTFVAIHGLVERIIARAASAEALESYLLESGLANHARLQSLTILGPTGVVLWKEGRHACT